MKPTKLKALTLVLPTILAGPVHAENQFRQCLAEQFSKKFGYSEAMVYYALNPDKIGDDFDGELDKLKSFGLTVEDMFKMTRTTLPENQRDEYNLCFVKYWTEN